MKVVLLGPPGSGKGTQAEFLKQQYGVMHLSTGALLRLEIEKGTELGLSVKKALEEGTLLKDSVIIELVEDLLDQPEYRVGFVLDGFPRTLGQAESLDRVLEDRKSDLDHVINIQINEEALIERIEGRFHCVACKTGYNAYFKPLQEEGICDVCGGDSFEKRSDDKIETLKERFALYRTLTEPVIAYYKGKGILKTVDGLRKLEEVSEEIKHIVERKE